MLKDLHWLPVKARIEFKILLIVFNCVHGHGPSYLKDLCYRRASLHSFSICGLWNINARQENSFNMSIQSGRKEGSQGRRKGASERQRKEGSHGRRKGVREGERERVRERGRRKEVREGERKSGKEKGSE